MSEVKNYDRIEAMVARGLGVSVLELRGSFRPASLADLDAVGALRDHLLVGGRPANDRQYLLWRYWFCRDREFGGEFYVLEHHGRLIAGIGTEKVVVANAQGRHEAWIVMDIVVAPESRDSGIGFWMQVELLRRIELLLVTGSNSNSDGIVRRFFSILNRPTYVLVLNSFGYFYRMLGSQKLAWAVSSVTNLFLRLRTSLLYSLRSNDVVVSPLSRFDDDANRLHTTLFSSATAGILRSAESLNWRVFDNPRDHYQVLGAYVAGVLRGYIVLQSERFRSQSERKIIVDLAVEPEFVDQVGRALLRHAIRITRDEKFHTLAMDVLDPAIEAFLARHGFISRKNEIRRFGFQIASGSRISGWLQSKWRICPIDGDVV